MPTSSIETDFSVVLFRPHCMLVSEEHPMKVHKTQWLLTTPSPLGSLREPAPEAKSAFLRYRRLYSGGTGYSFSERCLLNLLIEKHFHGASSAGPHECSLKSRYGKVRRLHLRHHGVRLGAWLHRGIKRRWHGRKWLMFMHFHGVFLGNQHAMWSKQHNGKVSPRQLWRGLSHLSAHSRYTTI
jgi:hypothetical protein